MADIPNSPVDKASDLKGFANKISRYFLDFLETDFKRQQAPRRKIQTKTDTGFRCGVHLRKYAGLNAAIWKLISEPSTEGFTFRIPKGRFTAPISAVLLDLISKQIDSLELESFDRVKLETLAFATRKRGSAVENPEKYIEEVQTAFAELVSQLIVAPVLALLDGPFRQQAYSVIDSVYELETELADVLAAPVLEQLPSALNTFIVSGNQDPANLILNELFSEKEAKQRVKDFFESFATADSYQEVRDLLNYSRTGDNLQFYLYLCELRFGNAAYPVFYIPATVTLDDKNADFKLEFDPHLYVNKRAIDYICQEQKSTSARIALSPIEERIIYLDEGRSLVDAMEKVLIKMTPAFDLSSSLDLRQSTLQTASSALIKMRNSAFFGIFDKSDESLLNDYEELLTIVNGEQSGVGDLFLNIINGFLNEDPVSFKQQVHDGWDELPPQERLVAETPIPLNEEQRKVLMAIADPACKYIVVQGPPGTGKSHTITAIAFDCILKGRNILVLSDKQEALDVVQDKLKYALQSVRLGDEFPDPILRLGRTTSTYAKLISASSQERIQNHYRAAKSNNGKLLIQIGEHKSALSRNITETIGCYGGISIQEIEEMHEIEHAIGLSHPDSLPLLREPMQPKLLDDLAASLVLLTADLLSFADGIFDLSSMPLLLAELKVRVAAYRLHPKVTNGNALKLFSVINPSNQQVLQGFIAEYDSMRWPVLGFLFTGSKARALNVTVGKALACDLTLDLHKKTSELRYVSLTLSEMSAELSELGLPVYAGSDVYKLLLKNKDTVDLNPLRSFVEIFLRTIDAGESFDLTGDSLAKLQSFARYAILWNKIKGKLESVPVFDYVGASAELEQLYTSQLAHEIDKRFLDFTNNHRATAKSLGAVIKAKQQFPKDTFDDLKNAFPCIIAGIRDFAEYVPLKEGMFDVVVIDEGSQVSVAQAFPALLRAKTVVVFGDQKQFSNVKSANASNELNQRYLSELEQHFRQNIGTATDKIQRLKQFDVKKSVLEFFDLIANYTEMLRKHFRGYQELISFSSKTFYGGQLQAIKVRGKPIEEVIKFTVLELDDRSEKYRNINTPEAEFILAQLKELVDTESPLSVGIITPFREQQQLLTRMLFSDSYAAKFESQLRLKVMTFDSCQGEERDIIYYSLVATSKQDGLNYIFPVELGNAEDLIEDKLRLQRLNVGFSRAKETIHFVLSKPIDQFKGSIGRVLNHYDNILKDKSLPEAADTDPASPMERKVLDWISKSEFYQKNNERVELIAQFPIGDYLRQLDPYYTQPAYRCDFLLRYHADDSVINIVIEYDGFQEHFIERKKVNEGNWDQYYRPEDIERQMTLESYGYKFLRINRFNMGQDPVSLISERLYALVVYATKDDDVALISDIRDQAENLGDGSSKHCKKCDQVKAKAEFFDQNLGSGKGGFGLICLACKTNPGAPISHKKKSYRSYSRFR